MATELAILDDVKNVLRITTVNATRDAQLTKALEQAEAWLKQRFRGNLDFTGTGTAKFYSVTNNAIIHMPVTLGTVTQVRVGSPGFLRILATNEFFILDNQRIRLRAGFFWPYGQFDDLRSHATEMVEVVEVDYTAAAIPVNLSGGLARLAASLWLSTPDQEKGGVTGITKERIGDYSYEITTDAGQTAQAGPEDLWSDGVKLLRPWLRSRVSVS